MTRHDQLLTAALAEGGGLIERRQHPQMIGAIDWAVRCARLQAVLPGIYALPEATESVDLRARAAILWDPDAVVLGAAAARLTFWPTVRVGSVEVSTRRRPGQVPGFSFSRRTVPPDLVLQDAALRLTSPALTALHLCASVGGDGIDQVLRARAATLDDLRQASLLIAHRPGTSTAKRLLHESRDEPWSAGERLLHRLLRTAQVTGWRANHRITIGQLIFYLDVGFPGRRLALEVDGRYHQEDPRVFESDRWRQNWLILAGWRILRFTWPMLNDHPTAVIQSVRQGLALGPSAGLPPARLHRLARQDLQGMRAGRASSRAAETPWSA